MDKTFVKCEQRNVALLQSGKIWHIADNVAEAEQWRADLLAKGATHVELKPEAGRSIVHVIITLDRSRANEILGYEVGEEEWLDISDDEPGGVRQDSSSKLSAVQLVVDGNCVASGTLDLGSGEVLALDLCSGEVFDLSPGEMAVQSILQVSSGATAEVGFDSTGRCRVTDLALLSAFDGYEEQRKLVDARFARAVVSAVDEHVRNAVGTRPLSDWTDHDVLDQGVLARALAESGLPAEDADIVKLEDVVSPLVFWRFNRDSAKAKAWMDATLATFRATAGAPMKLSVVTVVQEESAGILVDALKKIQEVHKFNVASVAPSEVHSIAFQAIEEYENKKAALKLAEDRPQGPRRADAEWVMKMPARKVTVETSQSVQFVLSKKDAALNAALPALIRLGDFVGNVDEGGASGQGRIDRCQLVLQVRDAIEAELVEEIVPKSCLKATQDALTQAMQHSTDYADAVATAVFNACKRQVEKNRSLDNLNLDAIKDGVLRDLYPDEEPEREHDSPSP